MFHLDLYAPEVSYSDEELLLKLNEAVALACCENWEAEGAARQLFRIAAHHLFIEGARRGLGTPPPTQAA